MNRNQRTAVLVASFILLASCDSRDPVQPVKHAAGVDHTARVQSPEDAIAVVRRATKRRGGDPNACEYRANPSGKHWFVMASEAPDPHEARAGRFPSPGSFTTYLIGNNGQIVETMPGL